MLTVSRHFSQTYFGMDVSSVEDPVQRRALETMIKTYGQTPRQLFSASHMSRASTKLMMEGELPAAMGLLVQLAFRETREQAKEITCPVIYCSGSVLAACCALRKTLFNKSSMKWSAAHLALSSPHPHRAHCRGSKVWSGVSTWARPRLQTQWCASASRTGRGSDPCWRCRPEPSAGSLASSASWWFTARSKVGSPPLNHEAEWI